MVAEFFNGLLGRPTHHSPCCRFNPPPATRPGETYVAAGVPAAAPEFQSAPGHQAGGNLRRCGGFVHSSSCFNPPPATRPGETLIAHAKAGICSRFNPPP